MHSYFRPFLPIWPPSWHLVHKQWSLECSLRIENIIPWKFYGTDDHRVGIIPRYINTIALAVEECSNVKAHVDSVFVTLMMVHCESFLSLMSMIKIGAILDFDPIQICSDLWPIILCNFKTKHRRFITLYIFGILMTRQTIWHYFQRNRNMFQFFVPFRILKVDCGHLATICCISKKKMLLMLLLNSVQNLTVLTFCALWMCLAALLGPLSD